jgi:hypothetical protein
MWRTSRGERVLTGAEWNLFREGLTELWDTVEDDFDRKDACNTGHAAFDALQPGQKLAMLALVGQALCDDALPSPEHTAHNEATIAAVFEEISLGLVQEVTDQERFSGTMTSPWAIVFWTPIPTKAAPRCRRWESSRIISPKSRPIRLTVSSTGHARSCGN